MGAENVDEGVWGFLDDGDGDAGMKKVEERGERVLGGLAAGEVAGFERVEEVLDDSGGVARARGSTI